MRYTISLAAACAIAAASADPLVDVLKSHSDTLSLFTQIIQKAGLVDTIKSMDAATIFAPTNQALQDALQAFPNLVSPQSDEDDDNNKNTTATSQSNLDLDNVELSDEFVNLLMYHVVPSRAFFSSDILPFPGSFLETALEGQVVNPYITENDGINVFSREKRISMVEAAGIEYDNGVIHTIESVLLPPQSPTVTALGMGFTYLYGFLEALDLVEDVNSAEDITVLIPKNSAFVDVGSALEDYSTEELSTILQFHVIPGGAYYTTNITDGLGVDTLANTPYESNVEFSTEDDGQVYANNARIITANILLSNGVAHMVDEVLNPANQEDGGYVYELGDDGLGVPAFESPESATLPAYTSGIPTQSIGTFSPTATYDAGVDGESGAESLRGCYTMQIIGVVAAASVFGALLV